MRIESSDLKLGEMYHSTMMGLVIITELDFTEKMDTWNGRNIGKYMQVFSGRTFLLYDTCKFYEATDDIIVGELNDRSGDYILDKESILSIYDDYIAISDENEVIILHKEAALKLKEFLNREIGD